MYSNVALSLPSSIGKMLLKTLSIPLDKSFICSLKVFDSRNSLYEFFCTSIRLGMDKPYTSLPKFFLIFFFLSKR